MCESVAQASWQSSVVNGNTLTHERVGEFLHAAHAAAARLGMLDVNVVTVHGQPAAFFYGYHYNGNITALRTGFDAASDGEIDSALMLQTIQDSCGRGDRTIDFGPGEHEHKRQLRTRTESTYRLTYAPLDSWRSQAVRFTRWANRRMPRRPATATG
jgi:CelD/BcsL family acetyltransferase involved in cellulose biosynthesis